MTSNVGQTYPYASETDVERATAVAAQVAARAGLAERLAAETSPLDQNERWWVWKCPTLGCRGLLHVAGYARDVHGIVAVCDGTCGQVFAR